MHTNIPIISIIDEDEQIVRHVSRSLRDNNFLVKSAYRGTDGMDLVARTNPHLVIVGMELPDITGESVVRELRVTAPETPLILLSTNDSVAEKVKGFALGADDYIVKPFATEELMARIRARLRSQLETGNELLSVGDLELDPQRVEVRRGGTVVPLTPNEFKLLQYLMSNPGIVLSRDMILNRVWMSATDIETRVVDVYIGYLRKKIDRRQKKKLLHSVRGFGYTLRE